MTTATDETIHREDRERVAILSIDHPDRRMNVVDERVLADLRAHVDAVLADDVVDAVVLRSGKPGSFGAGADVGWLPELAARDDAEAFLAGVHELMLLLVRSPKPVVTAIDGIALGGAFELALGGHAILASPEATIGLPEVQLDLLPGGGGTQLLGRFVSARAAAEVLTSGRRIGAEEAVELGLVTEVVAAEELLEAALARALASVGEHAPSDPVHADAAVAEISARRAGLSESRRGLSLAAERILDVLTVGITEGLESGLAAERHAFLEVLRSPQARAAIHLFVVEGETKRRSRGAAVTVAQLGVVGGGQMGAGIAATAVSRGLHATVVDVEEDALRRASDYLDRVLARAVSGDHAPHRARWSAATDRDRLGAVDAVVEAVFELPELKLEVLGDLSRRIAPDALLATNTSAISIAELAVPVERPDRFLGMHFFSPVERMPLVELIPHEGTSPETRTRAAALARQLGKVPVVVGDAPGFFTSRVYARWLIEGVRLLLDGVAPADIDAAARSAGFPVGPLQAHDEATLELVLQASITQVADRVMADRVDVGAVRGALEALVAADIRGRRHGLGFYRYDPDGRRREANAEVLSTLGVEPRREPTDRIAGRLLLAFATECYRCWDDGTLCHPDDGDVAAVLGIGFPRVLGGPFHWADQIGAQDVLARCASSDARAFPAGEAIARFAATGGRFADEPRRPAPFRSPGA